MNLCEQELNRLNLGDENLLHSLCSDNNNSVNPISKSKLYKASSWKEKNKKFYKVIVRECLLDLNRCAGKISLKGIIAQLKWEERIPDNTPEAKVLQAFIEEEFSDLKGNFKSHEKKETVIKKEQLIKLIDQIFDM